MGAIPTAGQPDSIDAGQPPTPLHRTLHAVEDLDSQARPASEYPTEKLLILLLPAG